MQFKIFRLCRDQARIEKLKEEEKLYSLPKTKYVTGVDLYTFLNNIIKTTKEDYALVCHDDVILPKQIKENIEKCINSMDAYVGKESWGIMGNAGVEVLTKDVYTYLSDPHTLLLPPKTDRPRLVESIDGNTMLLNIKNLKKKNVSLPKGITGFHLYDLILCLEIHKAGLVCSISSDLYVNHLSGGNYQDFVKFSQKKNIQEYIRDSFSNKLITTINGDIKIKMKKRGERSIENVIEENIKNIFEKKRVVLNILTLTNSKNTNLDKFLKSINNLNNSTNNNVSIHIYVGETFGDTTKLEAIKKEYPKLTVHFIDIEENNKGFSKNNIKLLLQEIPEEENSFLWFVNHENYISPSISKYLQFILFDSKIIVGNTLKDSKEIFGELYTKGNVKSYYSTIYETTFFKELFKKYATEKIPPLPSLFLLASAKEIIYSYPIPFVEVLPNEKEDFYEYTSVITNVINNDIIQHNIYNLTNPTLLQNKELNREVREYSREVKETKKILQQILKENERVYNENKNLKDKIAKLQPEVNEFRTFKQGYIWKSLEIYRKIKKRN